MHPLFWEIHSDLPREGPGDDESTGKAFRMLEGLPTHPCILDIGCGPGMQTLELARLSAGQIIALDNHQPFLNRLQECVHAEKLNGIVHTVKASMDSLPFPERSFDVLWGEGSIYIIGFAQGLRYWKGF